MKTTTAAAQAETELAPPARPEQVEIVLVADIQRSKTNPRKHNREPDPEFVESVRVHGVLQPVVVTFVDDQYELVFGEMRWLACKMAGRQEIPVIVREMERDEIFEVQVIENPKLQALMTHEQVAAQLGVTRARVTELERNALRKLRKSRVLRELFQ